MSCLERCPLFRGVLIVNCPNNFIVSIQRVKEKYYILTGILSPGVLTTESVSTAAAVEGDLVLTGDCKPAAGHDVDAQSSQETRLEHGEQVGVGPQLILFHCYRESKSEEIEVRFARHHVKKENTLCIKNTTLAGKVVEFTHILCSLEHASFPHKASCRTYPLPHRLLELSESIPERGSLTDEGPDAVAADAAVQS